MSTLTLIGMFIVTYLFVWTDFTFPENLGMFIEIYYYLFFLFFHQKNREHFI